MTEENNSYHGNPNLKSIGHQHQFTPEEIQEKYNQQQQDQGSSLGAATPTATTSGVVEGTVTPTARTPNESDVAVAKIIEAQTGPVAAMNYLDNIEFSTL